MLEFECQDPEYDFKITGQKFGPYDINTDGDDVPIQKLEKWVGSFTDFGETYYHMMDSKDFFCFINNLPVDAKNTQAWIIPDAHVDYSGSGITPQRDWLMALTYEKNGLNYCAVNCSNLEPIYFDGVFLPLKTFVFAGYGAPRLSTFGLFSFE
jgi:hypothetical protein